MPTSLHVIRLAGIWEITPFVDGAASRVDGISGDGEKRPPDRSPSPASGNVDEWTKARLDRISAKALPFSPGACRRFFNRPTNLAPEQPVYLEWTGLRQAAQMRLNGQLAAETAGGAETIRIRVDDRLLDRNELTLVLLRRAGETGADEPETRPAWPFRDCRLLIEER